MGGAIDHDGSVDLDETSCADVGCSYIASSDCSCDDICLEFADCCFDYCFECTDMPAPPGNELCASVSGDPHFHGRFGETYDVRGEANEVFNILSDHNMQLNTRYVSGCRSHSTVLGELGLLFNEQELYFSADEATLGGERMDVGRRHYLGEAKESWAEMQPNDQLLIVTPDYSLRFLRTQSKKCDLKHVDVQLHFRNEEARPHGLLGQTARESPWPSVMCTAASTRVRRSWRVSGTTTRWLRRTCSALSSVTTVTATRKPPSRALPPRPARPTLPLSSKLLRAPNQVRIVRRV